MKSLAHTFSSIAGFTLIEMVVTVAVALLLVGGGIAGYITFNSRQKSISAARDFETIIQTTEAKIQSGVVGACDQLEEYEMTFNTTVNPVQISLTEVCAPGDTAVPVPTTYTLPEGVLLAFNPVISSIRFKILAGGLLFDSGDSSVEFQFSDESNPTDVYVLTISEGGDVSEGVWQ